MGQLLSLDSGTLTPLAKRLQVMGLIARNRSEHEERNVEISLTAAGKRLRVRGELIPLCIMQLTGCQLPQVKSLTRELKVLRDQLVANVQANAKRPATSLTSTPAGENTQAIITQSTKYDRFGGPPLPGGEGWGEGLCMRIRLVWQSLSPPPSSRGEGVNPPTIGRILLTH